MSTQSIRMLLRLVLQPATLNCCTRVGLLIRGTGMVTRFSIGDRVIRSTGVGLTRFRSTEVDLTRVRVTGVSMTGARIIGVMILELLIGRVIIARVIRVTTTGN